MMTTIILLALVLIQTGWKPAAVSDAERRYLSGKVTTTDRNTILAWERDVTRDDTPEGREQRRERVRILAREVGDEKAGTYNHVLALKEYDCRQERMRFERVAYRDAKDAALYEVSREDLKGGHLDEWESPAPDTIDETMLTTVCRDALLAPGEKQ
jgi:hypothetical protein